MSGFQPDPLAQDLEHYLVGGAVRDRLLGVAGADRDFVVVGATIDDMLKRGFKLVGRDFPVFLHPHNGEEYALARTERKRGVGHTAFDVIADPTVTLNDDLARRDLTINAIALSPQGQLHDPFNGREDLGRRQLRHVSAAFVEDPLRVFRVARFAARLRRAGFTITPETLALMRTIAASGELETLSAERVWSETERALATECPDQYVASLRAAQALASWLPEVDALFGVPQRAQWHPEIDTGVHLLLTLQQAAKMKADIAARYAVLCHDLGKGITPKEMLPSHHGHETAGLPLVEAMSDRLRVPVTYRRLALVVCRDHLNAHRAFELRASTVMKLFNRLDLWRRPSTLDPFLQACEADARGRGGGLDQQPYHQSQYLRSLFQAASAVDQAMIARQAQARGQAGTAIGAAIWRARVCAIDAAMNDHHR